MRLVPNQRGAALITALMSVAVLALLAGSAVVLGSSAIRSSVSWNDRMGAIYAAESGINEALWRLDTDQSAVTRQTYPNTPPSFESSSVSSDLHYLGKNTSYKVWVEDVLIPAVMKVTAQGYQRNSERTVRSWVWISPSQTLFGPTNPNGYLECRSLPAGTPPCDTTVTVTTPAAPAGTGPGGNVTWTNQTVSLTPGDYYYSSLTLAGTTAVTVTGPANIYIGTTAAPGDFTIKDTAQLIIAKGGPVIFYVSGNMTFGPTGSNVTIDVRAEANANFSIAGDSNFDRGEVKAAGVTSFFIKGATATAFVLGKAGKFNTTSANPAYITIYADTSNTTGTVRISGDVYGGFYAPTRDFIDSGGSITGSTVVDDFRGYFGFLHYSFSPYVSSGDGGSSTLLGTWKEFIWKNLY